MKKVLALVLALLMVFALVACGSSGGESAKPSDSPKPSESAKPADSEKPADGDAAATPWESTSGRSNSKTKVTVDPYSRKTYQIVHIVGSYALQFMKDEADGIKSFEDEYNFKLLASDYQSKNDVQMQLLETYCDQGVDGFIIATQPDTAQAVHDLLWDAGIPALFDSTAWRDKDGKLITSGVELNAEQCGSGCSVWLYENYKNYLGDIDLSKAGYIPVTYSGNVNFLQRSDGVESAFRERFLKDGFKESNIWTADLVTQGNIGAEYAYNEVASILSGHPEIEYWFITPVMDTWGQGAARAIEAVDKNDCTLICSVGGEVLVTEWDNGYEGCWKACNFFEAFDFVEQYVPAIIAICDGTETLETIWPGSEDITGETNFRSFRVEARPATKDTYQSMRRFVTSA